MDQSAIVDLARHGIQVSLMVCLPVLAVALFTGLLISVFQAITQVQEMTLTFVPKLVGVGLVIVLMGGWMLTNLVSFTQLCFEYAARAGR